MEKLIQHGSTRKRNYTQNLSDGCDLGFWTEINQEEKRILSAGEEVILNIVRENIRIGLTTHPINSGKKWVKRALGQVE